MWIIGLLLLAAAVVVGIEFGISNDQSIDVEAFNHVWTSSPAAAFLVGVATALVGAFGLWVMVTGMRRSRVRGRSRRAEMAERDRLADERRRELDAMSTSGSNRDARDDEHLLDDRDRERVPADRRDDIDLRDEHDNRDDDIEQHAERRGMLHRSRH